MKNFETKKEIEEYFIKKWNLDKPTKFELQNWKCKFPLNISPSFLIGKEIENKQKKGIVEYIKWDYHGIIFVDNNKNEYRLSKTIVNIFNPITNVKEKIRLLPGAGCLNIWRDKFYVNPNLFKSIFYKTKEYQEKIKSSINKKYGCEHAMQNQEIKQKASNTIKEKYGVNWFLERGEHYKKIDESMIEKYGVKSPIKNEIIKDKIHNTIKERYGVNWFLERGEHYKKIDEIMIEKYGVTNIFHKETFLKFYNTSKIEKSFINEILNLNIFNNPKHILEELGQFCIKIDKKNYYVDLFDEETNIIIEFYGDYWHCNPIKYNNNYFHEIKKKTANEIWNNDLIRKNRIISKLKCTFYEVWEHDWIKNKESIIEDIKMLVKNSKQNLQQ
jgi:hypothetical protein